LLLQQYDKILAFVIEGIKIVSPKIIFFILIIF